MKLFFFIHCLLLAVVIMAEGRIYPADSADIKTFNQLIEKSKKSKKREKVDRPSRISHREQLRARLDKSKERAVVRSEKKRIQKGEVRSPREKKRDDFKSRKENKISERPKKIKSLKKRERHKTPTGSQRFQQERLRRKKIRLAPPVAPLGFK